MSIQTEMGKRLLSARLQRGISQKAVARRAGVDSSYLSRVESGKVQPSLPSLLRIAQALGVSLNDLFSSSAGGSKGICPVSPSGHCMVDLVNIHSASASTKPGSFSPLQLRVIRRFAGIVQEGKPEVLKGLDLLFAELSSGNSEPGMAK